MALSVAVLSGDIDIIGQVLAEYLGRPGRYSKSI
jgi:hypothetical protein